ncbi:ectonucleoside triphosphate diphosphohydrolase 6 [Pelobates cultripes]|uniref:nucleoside diphosphate phosphatase n=1 Tax=Pelobates cultripes TaxID=61616 RepID=A0AAD1RGB3_PELCU|nr:ectonucleoside triphosphate diphosphohydrolase 6 [Pelobates cultripes]
MEISKPCIFFCALCITLLISYISWHPASEVVLFNLDSTNRAEYKLENKVFYGIMLDAGSTGTRIHIYRFSHTSTGMPHLEHETFKAIKPGLSAYAEDPEKSAAGINELLDIARKEIPEHLHGSTPLVLKATAGLRLLPGNKAQRLLDKVTEIFEASPFVVGKDRVSIMDGTDEGIFAWITVNFLTGSLTNRASKLAGMLDLGGGSTQITFYPYDKETFPSAPAGYITAFHLFNNTYTLYSHSYLGLGLMSARLAIMGGEEGTPLKQGEQLVTPCLTPGYVTDFYQAGITYKVKGQQSDIPPFELCSQRISKILNKHKIHKIPEIMKQSFYAFSYYFDRAVDVQLLDSQHGGILKVKDFDMAAKKACDDIKKIPGQNPFLCMDLAYITSLLKKLGFPKDKDLKLFSKINDVETSWALGATFYYMNILNR